MPLEQTAAILDLFSPVADEIVCAVDSRVPQEQLAILQGHVDILQRFEFAIGEASIERQLPWLHSLCSGRWILRVDSDEVPSADLLNKLPSLVEAEDPLQYALPRRWLFPDAEHFIKESPWSDDWQVRLVRNERVALRFAGELHTNIFEVEPIRFVEYPINHLDLVVNTRDAREAKIAKYEAARPGLESESRPGWHVNNVYLPEEYQAEPSSPVPPADAALIRSAMRARRASVRRRSRRPTQIRGDVALLAETDRGWPLRPVHPDAYRATWLSVPQISQMRPEEHRRLFVKVSNDGSETWRFGENHLPLFRLAYRWVTEKGRGKICSEGRARFTADVFPGMTVVQPMLIVAPDVPGDYALQFGIVHEGVRWFAEEPVSMVSVLSS